MWNTIYIRRIISLYFIFILILTGFFVILLPIICPNNEVDAAVITVDPNGNGDYITIQAAIDNANTGDIVRVWAGFYKEHFYVNQSITLIGNGTSNTIIFKNNLYDVVRIKADWVNFTGFTINGTGQSKNDACIFLDGVSNCRIYNNNLINQINGIYLDHSTGNLIENNTIRNSDYAGIGVWYSPNNIIRNNTMINCGIYLGGSTLNEFLQLEVDINNTINGKSVYYYSHQTGVIPPTVIGQLILVNCTNSIIDNLNIHKGSVGLELAFCSNIIINNTNCSNNTMEGIGLQYSNNITMKNISCFEAGNFGIWLWYADNNSLENFTCSGINPTGVQLYGSNFNSIININCSQGKNGIYLKYSSNNTINNFNLWDNFIGIYYEYSDNNTIIKGTSIKNDIFGLQIYKSNYNKFVNITVADCGMVGFYISVCLNNLFVNNTSFYSDLGFSFPKATGFTTSGMVLKNNNFSNNRDFGIYLGKCSNIVIENNTFRNNMKQGIYGSGIYNSIIKNNSLNNNGDGMQSIYGSNTTISNNICLNNNGSGLNISQFSDSKIFNNNCSMNNNNGIYAINSEDIEIYKNRCSDNKNNGIEISSNKFYSLINNNICNNNSFNGIRLDTKLHYINNNTCNNNNNGIYIGYSNYNILKNNIFIGNNASVYLENAIHNSILQTTCYGGRYGFYIIQAPGNNIDNCTFSSHSISDIYLRYSGKNNTLTNSSINKITHFNISDELIIKNYLHIDVNDSSGEPITGVDIQVLDNTTSVYATSGYGGANQKTDNYGQIKWILVTDRILNKTGNKNNITIVLAKHQNYVFRNFDRSVNMDTSHFEYFFPNSKPIKVNLNWPINNSYLNDASPTLSWQSSTDPNSDPISYYIELDEAGGDWSSLVAHLKTNQDILTWDLQTILSNNSTYQWRVRANDSTENGSWSNIRKFTIDIDIPITNKPFTHILYNNSGTGNWYWNKSIDTGSGIIGYYVYIGTTPIDSDVINGEWVTTTKYTQTELINGKTYYCRIKAKNGANTTSGFSPSSDGVLIDTVVPTANKPFRTSEFNNTGTCRWIWAVSTDTGSGIAGYYVYIGTTPNGVEIINHMFTLNKYVEVSGLEDGNIYYCRIKAVNGAESISEFSLNSEGITVDLDKPIANIPISPVKFNSTGKVRWTWSPATNTGSGILGYFVTISKDPIVTSSREPTKDIVISDVWTINNWYEATSLKDGFGYYCHIKVKNGAGTVGEYSSDNEVVIIDKTAPSTPNNIFPNPSIWTNIDLFNVSWKNNIDLSGISGVYYKLDLPPTNNADGTFLLEDDVSQITDISVTIDGEHTIYIWLKDHAGNVNHLEYATTTLYLDTMGPLAPISILVTPHGWSSKNYFSIDWLPPADLSGVKTGVYYHIGSSPPKSFEDGTWTDQKPFNITNALEGENTIYLWLEDSAGNKDHNNYGTGTLKYDTTPPSISHLPINESKVGKNITINAIVTDEDAGVINVALFYRSPNDSNYTKLEMYNDENFYTFTANIPGNKVTYLGIEYYIMAVDRSLPGNVIYYGYNQDTGIEPNSYSDIDIIITPLPLVTVNSPTGTNISIYTQINISFNKAMDITSVQNAISVKPLLQGSYSWNGNQLIFIPEKPLIYKTTYTITVDNSAKDLEGNNIIENISWSFTTEYAPDNETPSENVEDYTLISISIILPIIIFIIIILFLLLMRKKNKDEKEQDSKEESKNKHSKS